MVIMRCRIGVDGAVSALLVFVDTRFCTVAQHRVIAKINH